MLKNHRFFVYPLIFLFVFSTLFVSKASADWVWMPELGKFVKSDMQILATPEEQYEHARQLVEAKDIALAKEAYTNLIKLFPTSPLVQKAMFELGELHEKTGDYFLAFKTYQRFIDSYPQSDKLDELVERQFKIGNVFLGGMRARFLHMRIMPALPKAIEVFSTVAENAPFSQFGEKAQFNLAYAYKKKKEYKDAVEKFKVFIERYPKSDLIAEAEFQIAETSFLLTKNKFNDEKMMRSALDHLEEYLAKYPNTKDAVQAESMLGTVKNKHAEKIYSIATYYERKSYIESAFIYYEEVINMYPDSVWAKKARNRLAQFKDPEKVLVEGRKVLDAEMNKLKEQREALAKASDGQAATKEIAGLETEMDQLEDKIKSIEKEKYNEASVRKEALRRKKKELKEKRKKLEEKEKNLRKHPSEDLEKALTRWRESLRAEEFAINAEEKELNQLEKKLGVKRLTSYIPFFGSSGLDMDAIQEYHAKELKAVEAEADRLKIRKKTFYAELNKIEKNIRDINQEKDVLAKDETDYVSQLKQGQQALTKEEETLTKAREVLRTLQMNYEVQRQEYKDMRGFFPAMLSLPKESLMSLVKPFKKESLQDVTEEIEKLKREQETLAAEKTSAQKELKDLEALLAEVIASGSDDAKGKKGASPATSSEKAEQRYTQTREEKIDDREMRKEIMALQKKINEKHNSIQDAQKKKEALVSELEKVLKSIKSRESNILEKGAAAAVKPAVFIYNGFHSFIFGLEEKETTISEAANKMQRKSKPYDQELISRLQADIDMEDTIIEQSDRELVQLELQLEQVVTSLEGLVAIKGSTAVITRERKIRSAVHKKQRKIEKIKQDLRRCEKDLQLLAEQKKALVKAAEQSQEQAVEPAAKDETNDAAVEELKRKLRASELEIIQQEAVVATLETAVEKGRKKIFGKDVDEQLKDQYGNQHENINEDLEHTFDNSRKIKKELVKIIDKEKDVVEKRQELLQEKLDLVETQLNKYGEYEDPDVEALKALKKDLFKKLDECNSHRVLLNTEMDALLRDL